MKRNLRSMLLCLMLALLLCLATHALENNMVKVGLKYGNDALSSANLAIKTGEGFAAGYYDAQRLFVALSPVACKNVTVSVDRDYHLQSKEAFESYASAESALASAQNAFVAYRDGKFYLCVGSYANEASAKNDAGEAFAVIAPSDYGMLLSETESKRILFAFDCGSETPFGLLPLSENDAQAETTYENTVYRGGFEFFRSSADKFNLINVIDIEEYTKCVVPYEMSASWPEEALKVQAVCARTYAAAHRRHKSAGFDICTTTDCQTYKGRTRVNDTVERAVEGTRGQYLLCEGKMVTEAVYTASNGGASEDAKNVWGSDFSYLRGKVDPYEADVADTVSNYYWTVHYTQEELSARLASRKYDVGTVQNIYVSEFTDVGNVKAITVVGTKKTQVIQRESARTSIAAKSMRFTISGGGQEENYYVDGATTTVKGLNGLYAIGSEGTIPCTVSPQDCVIITSSGKEKLKKDTAATPSNGFTITGTGAGHNVGMSQWGAYAMAKRGIGFEEILKFYYTGVTIGVPQD